MIDTKSPCKWVIVSATRNRPVVHSIYDCKEDAEAAKLQLPEHWKYIVRRQVKLI